MRTPDAIDGMRERLQGVDPFAALLLEWQLTAQRPDTRKAITAWSARAPALAGFASPAELVATINHPGDPARSCALLAELLVVAGMDRSAERAVLQAVTPGIRHAAAARWHKAMAAGPWRTIDEIATDAVTAAWTAIHAHAGHFHGRPARLIVGHVEGALRRDHARWIRDSEATLSLEISSGDASVTLVALQSPEGQASSLLKEALRCGVIDPLAAQLLTVTGVLGYPTTEAARMLALPYGEADRRRRRARRALRTWFDHPLAYRVGDRNLLASGLPPRRYWVRESSQQLQLPLDDDHQGCPPDAGTLSITTGARA
jgi:DNA-directed RNA polymerase specialized sigma24 family protein